VDLIIKVSSSVLFGELRKEERARQEREVSEAK
jgi:hypothetical protein